MQGFYNLISAGYVGETNANAWKNKQKNKTDYTVKLLKCNFGKDMILKNERALHDREK